jgi:hypothetical protein
MPPTHDLPLHPSWTSAEDYVESLLRFTTSNTLFRNLCGGIHVLDFLTREPDLYSTVLPLEWRDWFDKVSIDDVLELLLRAHVEDLGLRENERWKAVPESLLEYVQTIRRHCLARNYDRGTRSIVDMPRHIAVGMKPKKVHEVSEFAAYVHALSEKVPTEDQRPVIVDFGSGQNYLGRTLASPPYERDVIAIERRHHNVDGARDKDVLAKLATKEKIMRNKKEFKREIGERRASLKWQTLKMNGTDLPGPKHDVPVIVPQRHVVKSESGKGSMTYIEASIEDGEVEKVLYPPSSSSTSDSEKSHPSTNGSDTVFPTSSDKPPLLVISLHSCGNLSHHGLRSILQPSVQAIALIGCCYNLLTERLGPATYKLPQLRPNHPRLEATGSACDPCGFPMSQTLEEYQSENGENGVRLNITARMMAVQAPYNWGEADSEMFFRRHFYRALLQKILLDRGVVKACTDSVGKNFTGSALSNGNDGNSISGKDDQGAPLIVGSLRKTCFQDFRAYVHGALQKLVADPVDELGIKVKTQDLTDEEIVRYEREWGYAKKNLAVIWSLMAFSAGVVESVVVADRWLWLREQECVEKSWVEPVFEYGLSPRNLVVVGVKKREWKERNGE